MKRLLISLFVLIIYSQIVVASSQKWYEGGTLANATPNEWRHASYQNKLATCSDFVASLWLNKQLKSSIQNKIKSVDDMKPYCKQLVREIDEALRDSNDRPLVSETAAALFILLGWVK